MLDGLEMYKERWKEISMQNGRKREELEKLGDIPVDYGSIKQAILDTSSVRKL